MKTHKKFASILLALIMLVTAAMPAFAAVNDTGFTDVDPGDWYAEAVTYCRENGLMQGRGGNRFAPNETMTRAELVTVLYNAADKPAVSGTSSFVDVAAGQWYTNAVIWANQNNIVSGYGNGRFGTSDPVKREQIAAILWRDAGQPAAESGTDFTDESAISSYAVTAVDWARTNGIVNGKGNNRFDPQGSATRAEVATMLMNYMELDKEQPTPTPSGSQRVLVAYFSGTGTTRGVARNLVSALGEDKAVLHEIIPEQPYTAEDLNYNNPNCRSVTEQHDPNARPAIANSVENMDDYDIVFLGYPIWNNDAPRIIYTFLESEEMSGKTIVPFCTSGGSGISNSVSNIRGLASDATWQEGRRCTSSDTAMTLAAWANGLGLDFAPSSTPAPTPVPTPDPTPVPTPDPTPAPDDRSKVLVAYFSATNTTEGVAQRLAAGIDGDIYEIIPATPYTSADLNYGDSSSRTTIEMNDPNSRPAISGSVEDMGQYDVVFIGYPIWWGQAPRIISTFLESYDFSGKTIVPFCTSNSSGIGSSATNLESLVPGTTWTAGRRFTGTESQDILVQWANGLDLNN